MNSNVICFTECQVFENMLTCVGTEIDQSEVQEIATL